MRSTSNSHRDDGFAIVLFALLLVFLMIVAALAIDVGALYNARRSDQNAADTGALGGAQSLGDTNAILIAQVQNQANSTLGVTLTAEQWNSCSNITDPDQVDTALSGANCITVNGARTQVQVRIPTRQLNAIFGRAAGVNAYDHGAFAIAVLRFSGFGSVLPFAMPAGAGAGDGYACIKSGSGGTSVFPCGSSSGNFGYVDFGQFGNADVGTLQDCGSGGQRPRSANNMAVGVDHEVSTLAGMPHFGTVVVDTPASCSAIPQVPQPNSMGTITGGTVSNSLAPGMAFGQVGGFSDGNPNGRLARTSPLLFDGGGASRLVNDTRLDDNPLWEFIPTSFPGNASVPTSCVKSVFTDVRNGNLNNLPARVRLLLIEKQLPEQMRLLLQRCFTHYGGSAWNPNNLSVPDPTSCPNSGCTDAVFSRNSSTTDQPDLYDIQYTPRFGYVAQLTAAFPNGNSTVSIGSFRAVFLQRLLGACGSNTCGTDFEPGLGIDKSGSPKQADAITAFVFSSTMLPNGLASSDAPFAVGRNRFVSLIR